MRRPFRGRRHFGRSAGGRGAAADDDQREPQEKCPIVELLTLRVGAANRHAVKPAADVPEVLRAKAKRIGKGVTSRGPPGIARLINGKHAGQLNSVSGKRETFLWEKTDYILQRDCKKMSILFSFGQRLHANEAFCATPARDRAIDPASGLLGILGAWRLDALELLLSFELGTLNLGKAAPSNASDGTGGVSAIGLLRLDADNKRNDSLSLTGTQL